jgi:hypothetical protein
MQLEVQIITKLSISKLFEYKGGNRSVLSHFVDETGQMVSGQNGSGNPLKLKQTTGNALF